MTIAIINFIDSINNNNTERHSKNTFCVPALALRQVLAMGGLREQQLKRIAEVAMGDPNAN